MPKKKLEIPVDLLLTNEKELSRINRVLDEKGLQDFILLIQMHLANGGGLKMRAAGNFQLSVATPGYNKLGTTDQIKIHLTMIRETSTESVMDAIIAGILSTILSTFQEKSEENTTP